MIELGFPVKVFRAITLGLSLGDEIGIIVDKDKITAATKSPGTVSAGIIEVGMDGITDFKVDEELPFTFGITLSRLSSFAKGCRAKKGSIVRIKISGGDIEYRYIGDRIRYLKEKSIELGWDVNEFVNNIKELCRDIMKEGMMLTMPVRHLKQSVQDVRKYMKSGEIRFVIDGDKVLFEGADEITRFGFGLANVVGIGEVKRMTIIFSMDILRELVDSMIETGDTVNLFIVEDKPIVAQLALPGGEALYAAVPRIH